ncbi:MAG: hypothetical protein K5785_09270 [Nitrosarchaeum sp.]|nr:hypothetical protein [Nitrosarchaeum sp.]
MNDKKIDQMLKTLKDIDGKLSILISLQKTLSKPPKLGSEEKAILKLCNGKNSITEIMEITSKKRNNVESTLSHLRKKGIIKSAIMNRRTVYVKI